LISWSPSYEQNFEGSDNKHNTSLNINIPVLEGINLKLPSDILEKTDDIYELLLSRLTIDLNKYHNVEENTEYWEYILGLWLNDFIKRYFIIYFSFNDKFENVNTIEYIIGYDFKLMNFIPDDYNEYIENIYRENSVWDKFILQEIAKGNGVKIVEQEKFNINKKIRKKSIFINYFLLSISFVLSRIMKKTIFIHRLYVRKQSLLKIVFLESSWKTNYFDPRDNFYFKEKTDLEFRNTNTKPTDTEIEKLYGIIKSLIPRITLEEYSNSLGVIKIIWPRAVQNIVTSNSHLSNDLFKIYLAENSKSSRIHIHQHGGDYGTYAYHPTLKYELKIADNFYTWGKSLGVEKAIGLGNLYQMVKRKRKIKKNFRILLINRDFIWSERTEFYRYKNFISKFVQALDDVIKPKLLLRTLKIKLNLRTMKLVSDKRYFNSPFEEYFLGIKKSSRTKDIVTEAESKILTIVMMSTSTPFIEILGSELPFVLVIDKKICVEYELLSNEFKQDIEVMIKMGICFTEPESLAKFLNHNIFRISEWWDEINRKSEILGIRQKYSIKTKLNERDFIKIVKNK
jgi:putative transferase (TIGR04331 family)